MISLFKKNYTGILVGAFVLVAMMLPGLASAAVTWDVSGQEQTGFYSPAPDVASPQNYFYVNAEVDFDPAWYPPGQLSSTYIRALDIRLADDPSDPGTIFASSELMNLNLLKLFIDSPTTTPQLGIPGTTTTQNSPETVRIRTRISGPSPNGSINTISEFTWPSSAFDTSTATTLDGGTLSALSVYDPSMIASSDADLFACVYLRTDLATSTNGEKIGCAKMPDRIIPTSAPGETDLGDSGEGSPNGATMEFDKLQNPLCQNTGDGTVCSSPIGTVTEFIERILNIVIMIGIPIVVLALIWAGFLYVKAQGSPDKITEAHKTLLWTIVGAALLMGSWAIANAIKETVEDIGTTASLVVDYQEIT